MYFMAPIERSGVYERYHHTVLLGEKRVGAAYVGRTRSDRQKASHTHYPLPTSDLLTPLAPPPPTLLPFHSLPLSPTPTLPRSILFTLPHPPSISLTFPHPLSIPQGGIIAMQHVTRAPSRFSQASFIRELETIGVGRPSTYAKIFQILKERGYVHVDGQTLGGCRS
jgi:DNA topoisomerase